MLMEMYESIVSQREFSLSQSIFSLATRLMTELQSRTLHNNSTIK